MTDPHRSRLSELMVWAEDYYPTQEVPPPDLSGVRFSEADLVTLFDITMTAKAHLALVDQEPIRKAIERHKPGSPVRDAVSRSWKRHNAGGLDPVDLASPH